MKTVAILCTKSPICTFILQLLKALKSLQAMKKKKKIREKSKKKNIREWTKKED